MSPLRSKVRVNGRLTETSAEEVQNLTEQAGLPASPLTPQGVVGIGGNPDQAKMAGTPGQKERALSDVQQNPIQAIHSQDTLAAARRRTSDRTGATGQEQEKLEVSKDLQNLGSLGEKVTSMIQSYIPQLPGAGLEVQEDLSGANLKSVDEAGFRTALAAYAAGDQNALLTIGNYLGKDQNSPISWQELEPYYQASGVQLPGPETISATSVLGDSYTPEALASALGITPEQAQALTLSQLQDEISRVQRDQFSQVEDLRAIALDPSVGAAERAEARQALRDLGIVGIRAAEADMARLDEAVENADVITFAGQVTTIEELLSDEGISATIARALDDPDYRKELAETEPELAAFIDQHEKALADAAEELEAGVQKFADIQNENSKLQDHGVNGQLSDETMKLLVPTWGDLSGKKIDPKALPPVMRILQGKDLPRKEKAYLIEGLNQVAAMDPELAAEIADMDMEELTDLGILDDRAGGKFQSYLSYIETRDQVAGLDPKAPNYEGQLERILFGTIPGGEEMIKELSYQKNFRENMADLWEKQKPGTHDKYGVDFYLKTVPKPLQPLFKAIYKNWEPKKKKGQNIPTTGSFDSSSEDVQKELMKLLGNGSLRDLVKKGKGGSVDPLSFSKYLLPKKK